MTALEFPGFFSAQIAHARRFHLDLNPPRRTPLAVIAGGREDCTPDYEIKRSTFPFWGIEFVAQGRGRVSFTEGSFDILPGSIFSYGPRTWHSITTDRDKPLVKYFVDFTGSRSANLLSGSGLKPGPVVQTSSPGEILAILDDLIRNGSAFTPLSGRIATVILEHLLLKIAETSIPNASSGSPAFATYRRCRQHIQDHWTSLKSLGEIADACHVDPAYLCRLFKKFDRQSPYQLLLRLKINQAAIMLQSGMSVGMTAEKLLFADSFHFSRTFKKLFGIAPSQFARLKAR